MKNIVNIKTICLVILGITLIAGQSFESLETGSASAECGQCVELVRMVQRTRESNEISVEQLNIENRLCDSVCTNVRKAETVLGHKMISLQECQECISYIGKINAHYKGNDVKKVLGAMTQACGWTEFACKNFMKTHKEQISKFIVKNHDGRDVCVHLAKC